MLTFAQNVRKNLNILLVESKKHLKKARGESMDLWEAFANNVAPILISVYGILVIILVVIAIIMIIRNGL